MLTFFALLLFVSHLCSSRDIFSDLSGTLVTLPVRCGTNKNQTAIINFTSLSPPFGPICSDRYIRGIDINIVT